MVSRVGWHVEVESTIMYYDAYEIKHIWDGRGNHRLLINGCVGEWALYPDFAYIKYDSKLFAATTDYYWPELPEIFTITKLKDHEYFQD